MLWPNNKRLALMLSFDIDAETLWLTRNEINKNHPANLSRGLYSVKQGIPRILRMLVLYFFPGSYSSEAVMPFISTLSQMIMASSLQSGIARSQNAL